VANLHGSNPEPSWSEFLLRALAVRHVAMSHMNEPQAANGKKKNVEHGLTVLGLQVHWSIRYRIRPILTTSPAPRADPKSRILELPGPPGHFCGDRGVG
jgi:hypothetical protein